MSASDLQGRRGVAYVRVSDDDKQDHSRQVEIIQNWLNQTGLTISRFYVDSGSRLESDEREVFQEMMKDVENDKFDWIVIAARDRFGVRNVYEFGHYIHILNKNDVDLFSVTDGLISSDDSYTALTNSIGAGCSQEELKVKGERSVSKGMQLGKEGRYLGGHVPYGFDLVCYSHSGLEKWRVFYEERYRRIKISNYGKPNEFRELFEGKNNAPAHELNDKMRLAPTIDKHRIEVVKKIFHWFANELISLRTLGTRLNELGISPIYGEGWYAARLRPMLSNPAYIGMPTWNKKGHGKAVEFKDGRLQKVPWKKGKPKKGRVKKPTDHASPRPEFCIEAIIDESTWQKVQERLDGLKSYQKSPRNPELWLAGMLLCGKCGRKMIGWAGSKGKYRGHSYTCYNYRQFGKTNPSGCRLHKISNNLLEKVIEEYVHAAQTAISELIFSGFDREILRPFLERLGANETELFQIKRKMKNFISPYLLPDQVDCLGMEDIGLPISETYDELFKREKTRLEKELESKTQELEGLIDGLSKLSSTSAIAQEIGKRKITELDTQISRLKVLLEPLSDQITQVMNQLQLIDSQIAEAIVSINGNSISKKAKSLRRIIAKVICHFRYTDGRGNKPSSILDWVEIVPLTGDSKKICIHKEMVAGRDFIAKAISKTFSVEEIDRIKRSLGINQGLVKNPVCFTPDKKGLKKKGV